MSHGALALQSIQCLVHIQSGPDRGKKYHLHPPFVLIGRDIDNHIVLSDAKVSRHHLEITFASEGVKAIDRSGKNSLKVNGSAVAQKMLQDRDLIEIGESILMIQFVDPGYAAAQLSLVQAQNSRPSSQDLSSAAQNFGAPTGMAAAQNQFTPVRNKSPILLYVGVGVIVILVLVTLNSNSTKKPPEKVITTSEDISQSIQDSLLIQSEIDSRQHYASGSEKVRKEHSKEHFNRGFRDFQNGNYTRAVEAFQAALASDPKHELSKRYYRLALRKKEENIASFLFLGRRYKEKTMYSRCLSYMEKVMVLINRQEDQRYQQAKTLRQECEMLQGDH